MKDSFDDKLVQKIKASFNEAEFPIEEKDWSKFLTLIEPKKKGLIYVINHSYFKVAAVLIMIFVPIIWFVTGGQNIEQKELTENNEPQKEQIIDHQRPEEENRDSLIDPVEGALLEEYIQVVYNEADIAKQQIIEDPASEIPAEDEVFTIAEIKEIRTPDSLAFLVSNQSSDKKRALDTGAFINNTSEDKIESQIIVEEDGIIPATPLEIELSGLISYGQFEENIPPGVSGGIGASIPLSRRISITTGLYLSRQSLKIDDNGNTISPESAEGEVQEEVYANIFALDIPVNLRYYFRQKGKNQTYISTGFSSLTYLKERYFTESSIIREDIVEETEGTVITRKYIEQKTTSSSIAPFSNLDIAALLNVSVGFRYDLRKSYDLTIEPYIKYPLTSFTGQEVRIGSGGIKIVLNFTGQKVRAQK